MSECIEKFNVLNKLKREFLNIKFFYIFKDFVKKFNVF